MNLALVWRIELIMENKDMTNEDKLESLAKIIKDLEKEIEEKNTEQKVK